MDHRKKILRLIIIAFLTIVIFGGGLYFFLGIHSSCFCLDPGTVVSVDDIPKVPLTPQDPSSRLPKGWQFYSNIAHGYQIAYPPELTFDASSTVDNTLFVYDDGGTHYLSFKAEAATEPLETHVKNLVATMKADAKDSAAPVSITYAPARLGSVAGYIIKTKAGDVLGNSSESYIVSNGKEFITASYTYQDIYLQDDAAVMESAGGAPVSEELKTTVNNKRAVNALIHEVLNSFILGEFRP